MAEGTSGGLIESIGGMIARFVEIATASPEQGLLVAAGAILVGVSVAVVGYLAAGAAAEFLGSITPSGREPSRQGR